MAKLKIGDVIEIKTTKGLAYALYTHKHKQYGALLRVFRQTYASRPSDLPEVVADSVMFSCFFPLSAAVDQDIVSIVGNVEVPNVLTPFPTFRAGVVDPKTQKVAVWWLWDGENEWKIGDLTQEQRKLPIRGVWNDTLLVERIEAGWTSYE
jgi:hypothetical protein